MTSTSIPETSPSTALVPYVPPQSQATTKSDLERIVDAVYKHSIGVAKFEARAISRHLYQVVPPLTGPHSVGYTRFVIDGPKNTRGVGDSRIGIEVYAPTKRETGNRVSLTEFPDGHLEKMGLSLEQIQTLRTRSHDQIDPIEKARGIIIFSHGLGTPPVEYHLLIEELTSHGYLVLSLNHPSSSGYAPFSKPTPRDNAALDDPARCDEELERLAKAQSDNILHVVGLIQNSGTFPIVLAGHSLGGAAAIIAAQREPSIAACVNFDGALRGKKETRTAELAMPVLVISADHEPPKVGETWFESMQQTKQDFESFFKNPSVSSHTIKGTSHMDFCFIPISKWIAGENTLAGALKAHQVASQAMLRFMNSIPM